MYMDIVWVPFYRCEYENIPIFEKRMKDSQYVNIYICIFTMKRFMMFFTDSYEI